MELKKILLETLILYEAVSNPSKTWNSGHQEPLILGVTFSPSQTGHDDSRIMFRFSKGDQFFLLTRNAMEAVFSVSCEICLDVFQMGMKQPM